jgi:hypothetical protein
MQGTVIILYCSTKGSEPWPSKNNNISCYGFTFAEESCKRQMVVALRHLPLKNAIFNNIFIIFFAIVGNLRKF